MEVIDFSKMVLSWKCGRKQSVVVWNQEVWKKTEATDE